METKKIKLIAHYVTGCFCDKPQLPEMEIEIEKNGPLYFKKFAKEYCHKNGLKFCWAKSDYGGRAAGAILEFQCRHFENQQIRIEISYT